MPRTAPALGRPCRRLPSRGSDPHLQDAPSLVLLFLREHVSGEEGVAVQADSVGPVGIVLKLRPVVRAPGTHHLGGRAGRGLDAVPALTRELGTRESPGTKERTGFRREMEIEWGLPVLSAAWEGWCQAPGPPAGGLEMWAPLKELSLSPCMVPFAGAAPDPGGLTGTHPLHLITSLNTLSLSLPPSHLPSCGPSKEPALGLLPSLCNEGAVTWQGPHRSQVAASPPHSERAFTVLWLSVKSFRFCNPLNLRVKHVLI